MKSPPLERTFFLVVAALGYLVGIPLSLLGGGVVAQMILAIASVFVLVWAVALGVTTGLRDAQPDDDRADLR